MEDERSRSARLPPAQGDEVEAAETAGTLDVPLHLRIDRRLDERLRELAAAEHIPTSALVRRLLRQATEYRAESLSEAAVERIARRVAGEEIDHRLRS